MIKLRHEQPSLWAGILKEEIEDLWEPWMREAGVPNPVEKLIAHSVCEVMEILFF